jgi:CIC family chloride channel protein
VPEKQPLFHQLTRQRTGLRRVSLGDAERFLLLAILIGVFAGLLVVCFHIAIDLLGWTSIGAITTRFRYGRLAAPALGALVSSILVLKVFRAAQGSGVNQTKAALYILDGYVPASTILGKFIACSISIGSGNSLGPEDPSLQMGAGVASLLGRVFGLKRESMRMIAPVGAAAGIAAAFNTPIAGVLFVMEEVIAAWNAAVVGSILLAAVSAVVVERWFLGNQPLFRVPSFELTHPSELLLYALLGIVGGVLSAIFVRVVQALRRRLEHLPPWTRYVQPVLAGLAVGAVGLWLPQVMGAGYDAIDNALHDEFAWRMLLLLALAKMVVTLLCFSSGIPGGMFAPTLFTGAMIGGGLGGLAHHYWPAPVSPASAYVLVGMGTFFAGMFRCPMTSIFMVFEASASYVIIPPVAIAGTLSYFVSRALHPIPFFTMLARQEGVDLPSAEERRAVQILLVEDAMRPAAPDGLYTTSSIADALAYLNRHHVSEALAADGLGWVRLTRDALEASAREGRAALAVADELPAIYVPRLYPDLPADAAMRTFASHPLLPVVSRADRTKLVGTITMDDVLKAYRNGLAVGATRKAE